MDNVTRPDTWRESEIADKECYMTSGFKVRTEKYMILKAIDELYAREGNVRLDTPGCKREVCKGFSSAIFVCWEPAEGAPEVYEQPWSYVADYALGIAEEWCPMIFQPMSGIGVVAGKVWDPQGLAVNVILDWCAEESSA